MLNVLNVNRPIIVNGAQYPNSKDAYAALKDFTGEVNIVFTPSNAVSAKPAVNPVEPKTTVIDAPVAKIYRIEVRQYMTKPGSPDFDFMTKYNNDKPMPLRVMFGEIIEETKGMYKMRLHGRAEKGTVQCSHCMRELTHPVSRVYGIGPICGGHFWESTDWIDAIVDNEEALFAEADRRLREIIWEGWMPKKSLLSMNIL